MSQGPPTFGILTTTQTLQTIPCPPARSPERRIIFVLDCRAVLMDLRWHLLDSCFKTWRTDS